MRERAPIFVVLELFADATVPLRRSDAPGEKDESLLGFEGRTDGDDGHPAHILRRSLDPLCDQLKRIRSRPIQRPDAPSPVQMAGKRHRENGPRVSDRPEMVSEERMDVGADAVDMDVELVLCATVARVDRERERVARQVVVRQGARDADLPPSQREIVGGVGRQDRGVFDPGNPGGGDEERLGVADQVLKDREAVPGARGQTRHWLVKALLVGNAGTMDDVPQGVRIGHCPRGSRDQRQADRRLKE